MDPSIYCRPLLRSSSPQLFLLTFSSATHLLSIFFVILIKMLRSSLSKAASRAATTLHHNGGALRFMSAKEIKFGVDGRTAMLRGVDTLADAVQVRQSHFDSPRGKFPFVCTLYVHLWNLFISLEVLNNFFCFAVTTLTHCCLFFLRGYNYYNITLLHSTRSLLQKDLGCHIGCGTT
jgi:hypothetical protein